MNDVEAYMLMSYLGDIESVIAKCRKIIAGAVNTPVSPCSAHDRETALQELVAMSEEMGLYDEAQVTSTCGDVQLEFDFMDPLSLQPGEPSPGMQIYAPVDTEQVKQWGYDLPKVEDDSQDT